MLSHSGAFDMGAGTSVMLWPQEKLGVAALTNAEPTGAAEAVCAGFRQLLDDDRLTVEQLQTQKGPSREHPDRQLTFLANVVDSMRAVLRPPRRDAGQPTPGTTFDFEGTYASDFYGEMRVEHEGQSLVMYLGRKTADFDDRYVLRPTSASNVFVYDSHGDPVPRTTASSSCAATAHKATGCACGTCSRPIHNRSTRPATASARSTAWSAHGRSCAPHQVLFHSR